MGVVESEWGTVALERDATPRQEEWATDFTHHSYWFSLNPHPLILVSLASSLQSLFFCPENGGSRFLQNTGTYVPDSVSHSSGQ
jgi:hypothetical protein